MTSFPPPTAPPSPSEAVWPAPAARPARRTPGATVATLWLLRVVAGLQAVMLAAQPVLAGRFLDGDFPSLAAHGTNGLALMGVAWLVVVAAVLAWRPGRLPAWPIVVALACAMLLPIQLGMGHARFTAVHLALGVTLVGTGVALAVWAWRPRRATVSYRAAAPRGAAAVGVPR